jgi:hypothetical protein
MNIFYISEEKSNQKNFLLGTFQLKEVNNTICFLADDNNNSCKYSQANGIIENGRYKQLENNVYYLVSDNGKVSIAFLEKEGMNCWELDDKDPVFYEKLGSQLVLYDTTTNEWPEWCLNP